MNPPVMKNTGHDRSRLSNYALLSIAAAITTILLKFTAYLMTKSVGFYSDALESIINLAGAVFAYFILRVAAKPADEDHPFGHEKAEYFSSGVEAVLILLAAAAIAFSAIQRLMAPVPLERLNIGLAVTSVAALINLSVAVVLIRVGKMQQSITLEADGRHLLTDVWTSAAVLAAIVVVSLTGWLTLDPIIALAVAVQITWTGIPLLKRSINGLMDVSISPEEMAVVRSVLDKFMTEGIQYHELMARQSASRMFVSAHILVPGDWTVDRGHRLCEKIEKAVKERIPNTHIITHLESLDDASSWEH